MGAMLQRALGGARDFARRSRRVLQRWLEVEQPSLQPEAAPPPAVAADSVAALSSRVDRLSESLELWRARFEADQLAWQSLLAEEARVRDARIWDQLTRLSTRSSLDAFASRASLRAPRVPSEFATRSSTLPSPASDGGRSPQPGPLVRGTLEQVSLASLLGMFELERRDGIFRLSAAEGSVELELRRGAIVRARSNGQAADVVPTLGRAFEFSAAEFQFTNTTVNADSDAPQSLNALLLEVLYRHDQTRHAG